MEKLIPVVVVERAEDIIEQLNALVRGGIHTAEITLRTACAPQAIALAVRSFPDLNIGAGTVLNKDQCKTALDAGAQFIVSPGLSEEVALLCREKDIPYYPGCVTPTEIMRALDLGLQVVKFFPANVYGGLKALKALAAPFPQVKFIPTGGVDNSNLAEFLAFEKVFAVGGSFMLKGDIEKTSREAMTIVGESLARQIS